MSFFRIYRKKNSSCWLYLPHYRNNLKNICEISRFQTAREGPIKNGCAITWTFAGSIIIKRPCRILLAIPSHHQLFMALGEQSVNFTKISIVNNLRYPSSCYHSRFRNIFLRPSKAVQPEDNSASACLLPCSYIRQVLTVCWITPSFSARADSVHLHSGSVDAISRAIRFLSPWLMLHFVQVAPGRAC